MTSAGALAPFDRERFEGSLLGLALGDAHGAPFEGGPLERLLWRIIGTTRDGKARFTDDTQMALDVAESLIARGIVDQGDLARRFAASYRWSRGYGAGTTRVLRQIARGVPWSEASRGVHRGGSFGNGGAMRAPPVGLFLARDPGAVAAAASAATEVTHAHPDAIVGAVLLAVATAHAVRGTSAAALLDVCAPHAAGTVFEDRLAVARAWLKPPNAPATDTVRSELGHGTAARDSCVTALYLAARFAGSTFDELCAFVRDVRGDVDTIGAMAGAVWGALRGARALPAAALAQLEAADRLRHVAGALHGHGGSPGAVG